MSPPRGAKLTTTDRRVAQQYEALPYPARNPADESKRLIRGSPSRRLEYIHHVFGGRPPGDGFRVLVAGGGTGDALMMIAQELKDAGTRAEITYLDMSEAARKIAEARAKVRGLEGLRFVTGSLLELESLGLGPFDYIDCCGVLHHLASPEAGLAALAAALAPGGGLGIMVYGRFGRAGVYELQDALRLLAPPDLPIAERVKLARKLVDDLPKAHPFANNAALVDHVKGGDAGLCDLLLHARDRAYAVEELFPFAAGAGLRITSLIDPMRYEPTVYMIDPGLRRRMADLSPIKRFGLAERLSGGMTRHVFYAVRADNDATPPEPTDPAAIPIWNDVPPADFARAVANYGVIQITFDDVRFPLPMPRLAAAIAPLIDGNRSTREVHATLAAGPRPDVTWEAFSTAFTEMARGLIGVGKLFLLRGPIAGSSA